VERYHLVMATLAFVVVLGVLVWQRGNLTPSAGLLLAWANVAWMLHLAVGTTAGRLLVRPEAATP
jgi:hypothetical protein